MNKDEKLIYEAYLKVKESTDEDAFVDKLYYTIVKAAKLCRGKIEEFKAHIDNMRRNVDESMLRAALRMAMGVPLAAEMIKKSGYTNQALDNGAI